MHASHLYGTVKGLNGREIGKDGVQHELPVALHRETRRGEADVGEAELAVESQRVGVAVERKLPAGQPAFQRLHVDARVAHGGREVLRGALVVPVSGGGEGGGAHG